MKKDIQHGYMHVLEEGTLFLVSGQESYAFGAGGDEAGIDSVKTELATAGSSGGLTITVDSATGIASADVIGIELDDGTLQWTTVNGAPAAGVITITAALTGAAAADNHVYAYTSRIEKPVRILRDTVRLELASGNEIPVRLVSRAEYMSLSNKSTTGKCNQIYHDRFHGNTGTVYTWPTADDVKDVLHFTYESVIQDVDAATNNPHYPIEAMDYLVKALRYELSFAYGIPQATRMELKQVADEARDDWLDWDSEDSSIFLQPDYR